MGRWKPIDHTADLSLHIWADDLTDLFVTSARGMFSLMTDLDAVLPERTVELALEALDLETLLVDWLNELLYLNEVEGYACVRFEFADITPVGLRVVAWGGGISEYQSYVKAATFHNLAVLRTGSGYETEIVFDT
ncbi:MAG: archease [Anaerolineae bacterium]|nr:archease [Anaerolineae bacterium]